MKHPGGGRLREHPVRWLALLWLACPLTLHGHADKVHGDGIGYFVYARALAVHGDFRLRETDRVPTEPRSTYLQDMYLDWADAHGGRIRTQYPAGPALLWLPAVSLTHGVLRGLQAAGVTGLPPADGYSMPYRVAACWSTILAAGAGVLAAYALACRLTTPALAALAVAGTWFATPLFYYMSFEASMSEAPGFAAVTLCLLAWARAAERGTRGDWLLWGATAGVATLMRLHHAVLLAGPALEWLVRRLRGVRMPAGAPGWFALGALPVLLVQSGIWRAATGAWGPPPYMTGIEDWTKCWPWPVLFSMRHGLLASHPLWWAGLAGLLLCLRSRPPGWVWGAAAFLCWNLWVNQLPLDFWAGHAFGARRFVPAALACALGIAYLLERGRAARVPTAALAVPLVLLAVHSLAMIRPYRADAAARSQPVSPAPRGDGWPARVYRLTGWPFAWPANLAWAAAHGTTPDRWDLGSALFVDIPGDLAPADPARPWPSLEFTHANAVHVQDAGWTTVPGRGAVPPEGGGTVWINRCRPAQDSTAILDVEVRGSPGRATVTFAGRTVAAREVRPGHARITWASPAAEWGLGTHPLIIETSGISRAGCAVRRLTFVPAGVALP